MGYIGPIVSLLLAGGGAATSSIAASNERDAMNRATQESLAQQNTLSQRERALAEQSFSQSTPQAATQQIAQGQQKYLDAAKNAQATPLSLSSPAFGTDSTRQNDQARQGLLNKSNADLMGYGNYGLQQGLKDMDVGSKMNMLNQQSQQIANLLPIQLRSAATSEQGLASIGSLLGTVGQLAGIGSRIGGLGSTASSAMTPLSQVNNYPMSAGMLTNAGYNSQMSNWASNPNLFSSYGFN